ncbi:aspartate aminotransferase family protein [Inconstantimicrobium mannanitabidum]|uniref:Acetylornithine aminotransferase n=1 Tax=Inconstantimicrobium mannanitabidum TaxID=1604901 RepID=A0ACB5RD25_9CLOT|nr:aspartate aminotransferase family protein [Clostridium sp. TW13]GKX67062.1 acetylornithine aminotransferase [Clostridium sp. TW13]
MSYLMNTYSYLPVTFVEGKGAKLYDDKNKEYIDFFSGIGVASIGYKNEKWLQAVTAQISALPHCSNIVAHKNCIDLAEKLCTYSNMSKVFFANSGAEANEGAIKLARKYSHDKYGDNRNTIISLKSSFHGRTITTLTATGQDRFHEHFFPFAQGFKYSEPNNINNFKENLDSSVCAVMMEAIQGEGGVHPLQKDFVQEVVKICNEKDIVVIFDEIQCGVGRTGKFFGFEHFDVKADIVTLAKGLGGGLPIGAFMCNAKLENTLAPGDHGSTFGGNPVVCAGALAVLDQICNDSFLTSVSKKSKLILDSLSNLQLDSIVETRGIGLMIGIEIKNLSATVQKLALEKGLLVGTAGKNVIRLLPPLTITEEELTTGLNILKEVLLEIK